MNQFASIRVQSASASRPWPRRAGPLALLCALVAVAYGPAIPNFFVSDDLDMLSGDASDLFSPASGFGRFMPLAASIHRGAAVLFGLNPVPAHTVQLALHAASVLLVYTLARQLVAGPGGWNAPAEDGTANEQGAADRTASVPEGAPGSMPTGSATAGPNVQSVHGPRGDGAAGATGARGGAEPKAAALAVALLFALYPRHHQVVMWFGAVSIGVAAVLTLATAVLCWRAWRANDARVGWAAAGTYTAALVAHESAVILPLLLAALAYYESAIARRRAVRARVGGGWGFGASEDCGARRKSVGAGSGLATPPGTRDAGGRGAPSPRTPVGPSVRGVVQSLPGWGWAMVAASTAHLGLLVWAYRVRAATYPDSGYRFLGMGGDLAGAPLRYAAQLVVPPPWTESLALGAVGLVVGGLALVVAAWWAWRGGLLVRLGLAWTVIAGAPFVLFGIYGVADRYYYLPSVGLALAVAVALGRTGRWRVPLVAAYATLGVVLLVQVAGEWRAAGASVRGTMDYLAGWARASRAAPPEAAAFVGVPFKRGELWPGSQVYVFSTGLVGAAHLATGWSTLRVSYLFADEQPALSGWLAALPDSPGPPGLALFALDTLPPADRTAALGGALPELSRLRWRGASRTPIDWAQYAGWSPTGD